MLFKIPHGNDFLPVLTGLLSVGLTSEEGPATGESPAFKIHFKMLVS